MFPASAGVNSKCWLSKDLSFWSIVRLRRLWARQKRQKETRQAVTGKLRSCMRQTGKLLKRQSCLFCLLGTGSVSIRQTRDYFCAFFCGTPLGIREETSMLDSGSVKLRWWWWHVMISITLLSASSVGHTQSWPRQFQIRKKHNVDSLGLEFLQDFLNRVAKKTSGFTLQLPHPLRTLVFTKTSGDLCVDSCSCCLFCQFNL